MHVYHYAPYEPTALKRLMGFHGTREDAVDRLLREGRLIDLYGVVRQSHADLPAELLDQEGGGLLRLPSASAAVGEGGDSILAFERWLETGDQRPARRDRGLQRGGLPLDARAGASGSTSGARRRSSGSGRSRGRRRPSRRRARRSPTSWSAGCWPACPTSGRPDPEAEHLGLASAEQHRRWLMAQLLRYHRREDKPVWWQFFARLEMDDERTGRRPGVDRRARARPRGRRRCGSRSRSSTRSASRLRSTGSPPGRSRTRRPGRASRSRPSTTGRGSSASGAASGRHDEPLPAALIPGGPYYTDEQQEALRRLAEALLAHGPDGAGAFRARAGDPHGARRRGSPVTGEGEPLLAGVAEPEGVTDLVLRLRRRLPLRAGPAGIRQDPYRRTRDRRPARRGPAGRRRLDQPQGDPQPAARGRAGGARARHPLRRAQEGRPGQRGVVLRVGPRRPHDRELDRQRRLPARARGDARRRDRLALLPRGARRAASTCW